MTSTPSKDEPAKIKFLSFQDDGKDAEKEAKLKAAAAKIEQAIAREKSLEELVDYKPPDDGAQTKVDPLDDNRSLYDRLQEQRDKKKEAIEDSKKLSNLITKLDEDDVSHLNEISRLKQEEELKRRLEVYDALEAKKRLKKQKINDEELRQKESLLKPSNQSAASSSAALALKHKLAKSKFIGTIKVKPRTTSNSPTTRSSVNLDDIRKDESGEKLPPTT